MAVSTIGKEFITREFSGTFPAFSSGDAGSRVNYIQFLIGVSGYMPVAVMMTPMYAGATFTIHTCVDLSPNKLMVIQNRAYGGAEPNPYNFVAKVLYKKV